MDFHYIQREILGKLMFNPKQRFSDLQLEEITSKHFNYHLKKLVDEGLIDKEGDMYVLTDKGKDHVGQIDDVRLQVEKQPKISVGVLVRRFDDGVEEFFLSKRLKQPYYGKVGGFTGKVRFGETLEETARRELQEEAGVEDGEFKLAGIVRKMAYKGEREDRNFVQDQIMILFLVENVEGNLLEETKESKNFWYPYEKIKDRDDLYNTFLTFLEMTRAGSMDNIEIFIDAEGY